MKRIARVIALLMLSTGLLYTNEGMCVSQLRIVGLLFDEKEESIASDWIYSKGAGRAITAISASTQ